MIDVPDRTGETWMNRTINAKRRVFLVVGPPKQHGSEWRHPTLVLRSDNRPETVGTLVTAAEPKLYYDDPGVLWEHETSMTRIS